MAIKRFDWKGKQVIRNIEDAIPEAIDETTNECVNTAKSLRTGSSRASAALQSRNAKRQGTRGWVGQWGIFDGTMWWELFVEVGTIYLPGDNAKRRAAEMHYRDLHKRIKKKRKGK